MRCIAAIAVSSLALCTACRPDPREELAWSDEPTDRAVVWQGFIQEWGYNHRMNSLGDFVGPLDCTAADDCEVDLVHSAASGSGRDTARFTTWATAISAPDVAFLQGSFTFEVDLSEAEGDLTLQTERAVLALDGILAGRDQYHLLLAGFDIFARRDADKLQHITLDLEQPRINAAEDKALLQAQLTLQVDCDSLECDGMFRKGDRSVRYRITVPWLLVAGDDDDLALTEQIIETSYEWQDGGGRELQLEDASATATIGGVAARYDRRTGLPLDSFATALPAMTGLSIDLDRDHHMAAWASRVSAADYDPITGQAAVTLDLMFKQWNQGTRDFMLAYAEAGAADNASGVALLQLRNACTARVEADGEISWDANGRAADSDKAVWRDTIDPAAGLCR